MNSSLDTKLYFQIGLPLRQSVVTKVLGRLITHYGVNAVYLPLELRQDSLKTFMEAIHTYNLGGLGVTMPFKSAIIPYLDEIEETAKRFSCVNSVYIDENGKKIGYAFDGMGMCWGIEQQGVCLKGSTALVLGAGAVGGIVASELVRRGIHKIFIANRTLEKARHIASVVKDSGLSGVYAIDMEKDALNEAVTECNVVFQCTSLDMKGHEGSYKDLSFIEKLPEGSGVIDAIYNPESTPILTKASECGLKVANGMHMFAGQVVEIFEKVLRQPIAADPALTIAYMKEELAAAAH